MASQYPPELIEHLQSVLLELTAHPYPDIPSPPSINKRASVALVLRVQPHFNHWPPRSSNGETNGSSYVDISAASSGSTEERTRSFFAQDWVKHGDAEVLFIKRAARKGDRWTSHVALPGGRRDPDDADDKAAAIRETLEEVGIELTDENSLSVGNLPQRVVTTSWGKVPLMVLCPYIFLITTPHIPPLRLQPTEVASTHWVSLRALLASSQRTLWHEDVSHRLAKMEVGIRRTLLYAMIGKMSFAAIRLIPSESLHCSSIPDFVPQPPPPSTTQPGLLTRTSRWFRPTATAESGPDKPLLLWGLTLGVLADLLELLPPYNALELWTYPTFTPWDVRFMVWLMSYNFRKQRRQQLQLGSSDAFVFANTWVYPMTDTNPGSGFTDYGELEAKEGRSEGDGEGQPEGGISGLGANGHYKRVRRDGASANSSAVSMMLEGYYDIVRRAVTVALAGRVMATGVLAGVLYAKYRGKLLTP